MTITVTHHTHHTTHTPFKKTAVNTPDTNRQIPPPAPSNCVWFFSSIFGSKNPKNKTKIVAFKNPRIHKGYVNK